MIVRHDNLISVEAAIVADSVSPTSPEQSGDSFSGSENDIHASLISWLPVVRLHPLPPIYDAQNVMLAVELLEKSSGSHACKASPRKPLALHGLINRAGTNLALKAKRSPIVRNNAVEQKAAPSFPATPHPISIGIRSQDRRTTAGLQFEPAVAANTAKVVPVQRNVLRQDRVLHPAAQLFVSVWRNWQTHPLRVATVREGAPSRGDAGSIPAMLTTLTAGKTTRTE